MTEQDEAAALAAWRDAVATTDAAEYAERHQRNNRDLQQAAMIAEDEERLAARAYLAARDRAVAGQGRDETT